LRLRNFTARSSDDRTTAYLDQLAGATRRSPVTALLGPRQCGKTTLARMFAAGRSATRFDLGSQVDLRRLQNPELVLGSQGGLVVLDASTTCGSSSLERRHIGPTKRSPSGRCAMLADCAFRALVRDAGTDGGRPLRRPDTRCATNKFS